MTTKEKFVPVARLVRSQLKLSSPKFGELL